MDTVSVARDRLRRHCDTLTADEDDRDRLGRCIVEVIDAVESGYYPARLSALYLCMVDGDEGGKSILLPVLEGAAESERDERIARPQSTDIYDEYADAVVDDNGSIQTKVDFLSLQRQFGSPAEAVPTYAQSLVKSGTVSAEKAPKMCSVWSSWLRSLSWSSLGGRNVYDHSLGHIARRFQSVDEELLRVEAYSLSHPQHGEFLRTLNENLEEDSTPEIAQALRDCFVRVWRTEDAAETTLSVVSPLVDEAFRRHVFCDALAKQELGGAYFMLTVDEMFQNKREEYASGW